MVKKYYKDWKNFQDSSSDFLSQNFYKSRVTFKYRNKYPSYGKLYLTNDNKSFYIKLTKRKDIDKIETYFKGILHMMANKTRKKEKIPEKKEEKIENDENKKIIELDEEKEEKKIEKEKSLIDNPIPKYDRKHSKYKLTIKPEYITIEKRDNIKKRIVDYSQFSNEYKSNELFNWINIILEDWESYIKESISNKRIKSKIVAKELEKYQQCSQNVKPLLNLLQEKKLNQVILDKLFTVMVFAENKDLLNANDRYIDLSIGNAAWPMGLTMVGIHQRTGKSSISPAQVAYILNDEITKKYLQSIRRILSFLSF